MIARQFSFVTVAPLLGRVAIVELTTGEPLQFVTGRFDDHAYLELLCASWDGFLLSLRASGAR